MVRKLFILMMAFLLSGSSAYASEIWLSSTTATSTASTGVNSLCDSGQRGIFHGICTDFGVAAASTTIVNSTWTLTGVTRVGPITTLVADQCKYFDMEMPNALGYNKPNTAIVTILYRCQ